MRQLKFVSGGRRYVHAFALGVSLALSIGCAQAQTEAHLLARELIGMSVFSADGAEVGEVASVLIGPTGQINEIRMTAATSLALGPRVVVLPMGHYIVLQAAIVLDMPQLEVDTLPSASESEKRNRI